MKQFQTTVAILLGQVVPVYTVVEVCFPVCVVYLVAALILLVFHYLEGRISSQMEEEEEDRNSY